MAKHFKTVYLITVFLLPLMAKAQNCNINYLGTKTLYNAPSYSAIPLVPAGYQPVFINHVGRHGARHLTKEVSTSYAYNLLAKADSANGLTTAGQQLHKQILALDKVEHGIVKSISGEGKTELQGIGKRMYSHYPQVFAGAPKLHVGNTKEIRTKQSADAFLTGLKIGFKDSAKITTYTDDTGLRFYDASPAYTAFEDNGNWQVSMKILRQKLNITVVNEQIAKKWLSPSFIKTLTPADIDKLVSDVFGFATIVPSLKEEIAATKVKLSDINFTSFFTCTEISALSKIDVADDYLKKGPGTDNNGIQVRIAVPLLVNFINTSDNFLKGGDVNAELRFAHAETISPFATLLGIAKASKVAKNITQLDAAWQSSAVIPLSANIQWIFYRKKSSSEVLVKVLLNEQPATINGLASSPFPYYKWTSLRAFYINKLTKLNVKLTDDMVKYLKEVK